ncbi:MAG: 3-deoxy-7-phosphoheptulonate synthase class II [Rickettsiales bacterium]|nr:3-deoxy-7-phosphoheptulonate synthase class II [Rickettsiales bacterium]RPG15350.1 MAG: 3-deoxy-7-phosphoheptulonate synthase class II [Pelagibacteraceae bacterium TMED195]|tara:strand:+ start:3024 stop:4373 length:1350 start_codon:yes stop_codon:yes gene_type:complete
MKQDWTPDSWRKKKALHQPIYTDKKKLDKAVKKMKKLPPLVFAGEVRSLKNELAKCVDGKGFLLQAGDCAESFAEFHPNYIRDTFRVIMQMAVVLSFASGVPVTKVGRLAGQFAKPRSSPIEEKNGVKLPSYLGDMINGIEFNENSRVPNPDRMLQAYNQAASTQNLLRAFAYGGYADLSTIQNWNLDFVKKSKQGSNFKVVADRISECLRFIDACGINNENVRQLSETSFYISHEALLLPYETAFTRIDSTTGDWYDVSAHMVWIGDRTRQLNGAHVEFCKGISNPIGIKVGPSTDKNELLKVIKTLNPKNEKGKIVLIVRMGSKLIDKLLPSILEKIKSANLKVVWSCDPMHANIEKSKSGFKTRNFKNILNEVKSFFKLHKECGTYAGGIHLEMTGQNVTECIGGLQKISDKDLSSRYHTHCDPRLNASQSLELAFTMANYLKNLG